MDITRYRKAGEEINNFFFSWNLRKKWTRDDDCWEKIRVVEILNKSKLQVTENVDYGHKSYARVYVHISTGIGVAFV